MNDNAKLPDNAAKAICYLQWLNSMLRRSFLPIRDGRIEAIVDLIRDLASNNNTAEVVGYVWPSAVRKLQARRAAGSKEPVNLWPTPTGQAGMPVYTALVTNQDEVAGVRDTLIVAANNPVSFGGLEGLRRLMRAQAERLRACATTRTVCPHGTPYRYACDVCDVEQPPEREQAPWPDYAGNPIHEGDAIQHPVDGATGSVFVLRNETEDADRWRVLYIDDSRPVQVSRLCLQIGDIGQAVVVAPTSEGR